MDVMMLKRWFGANWGASRISMSVKRSKSLRKKLVISRRASGAPRHRCGPKPPKETWRLGWRVMSKRSGASKWVSSLLADS